MIQSCKYFIPSMLAVAFVILTLYAGFYYFFLLLLVANTVFNPLWGEFTNEEIREEIQFFSDSSRAAILKILNAIVLLLVVGWSVFYVDSTIDSVGHLLGFTLAVGVITGCFLVTLAHELLHGKTVFEKLLANSLLLVAGIPHFTNDHLFGHHRLIGLAEDETTAKYGDSFYRYFGKATWFRLKYSYFTSYPLSERLREKVRRENRMMALCLFLVYAGILLLASRPGFTLVFFVLQGFISYVLYELINYIQHYGLERGLSITGRPESIQLQHSWNCYYKYSNYLLFLLPLHSAHHVHGREQNLMGPRLPFLYFVMVALALVPRLWFRAMNPLVHQYRSETVLV